MPHRNLLLIVIVSALSYVCYWRCEQNPYARYTATTYALVDDSSWIDVPEEELFTGAVEGMVDVLRRHGDEHSQYIRKVDAREFEAEMRQQFGGIGVQISLQGEPPMPTIVGPPEPGTPAFQSEIRAGDVITAVDGHPTDGGDLLAILRLMRGDVGDPIELTLRHRGADQTATVQLVRETITIDSILGDLRNTDGSWQFRLDADPRIAYVRIVQFGEKTVGELLEAMADLTSQGIEALVLDLRDDAGGALQAAVLVSEMFLEADRLVVETRGRGRELRDRYATVSDGMYDNLPLAVLINQNTASASEIVAACLQDNDRATIVGERSYGKGTVQRVLVVGSRGSSRLKLTSATYWRPSGENIHRMPDDDESSKWGVLPDDGFEVKLGEDEYVAFRKYRSHRDLIQTDGESEAADNDESSETEEFVDRTLQRAVEHLQGLLGESSSSR